MTRSSAPVRAVLVGAGHRGVLYSRYAQVAPDQLAITAIVEPDPTRRERWGAEFGIPHAARYASLTDLPDAGEVAEAAIDATMDQDHVRTATRLLAAGYDVLLEKPSAQNAQELMTLAEAQRTSGRILMICHVLRYATFYTEAKHRILAGEIGEPLSIEMAEHVSYDHMSMAYVRGRWGSSEQSGSSMLLAKCCHDLDLMTWLCNSAAPARVASSGSRGMFIPERAPQGAGTRCLSDCSIEATCSYSARRLYVELNGWQEYVWEQEEHVSPELDLDQKLESLRTDNRYGRCVWRAGNDVLDRQSVSVEFADGVLGSFALATNTPAPSRTLHVVGTAGEISGALEEGTLRVRRIRTDAAASFDEEMIKTSVTGDMHGGGDRPLVADFVRVVRGEPASVSSTQFADSVNGHLLVFAAELARQEHRWVELAELQTVTGA
ncbi:Gfo/Idh/MocA family oxidoreductase [Streptomyces sp. RTGN2]|uniref:Gfo/Idh/MocA family protein n=1 Tax=Streptomyces sp. RTGN2 TaxID=3016525 RepID=UPI002557A809|nr:Gfo/Idh/MocA family oxidoreductase [Streptomyces sp. RTGN2]